MTGCFGVRGSVGPTVGSDFLESDVGSGFPCVVGSLNCLNSLGFLLIPKGSGWENLMETF